LLARAIVGDSSDNIDGIKGMGFKTLLKVLPFFSQKEKVEVEQVFKECEGKEGKYSSILNSKDLIMRNLKIMQLESPIISSQSIEKIKFFLDKESGLNSTSLRTKMVCDGIQIDENFFQSFRILKD